MNVLWFSWKDTGHPQAGGAEIVSSNIRERLARDGHTVRLITAQYEGARSTETVNGVEIYRSGNRYTVYTSAKALYKCEMPGWEDIVIDEMNTLPFLAGSYTQTNHKLLLSYQLARNVWFYQMIFPLSVVGYVLEPLILRHAGHIYSLTATESQSSKQEMERYELRGVHTFRVGMSLNPTVNLLPKKSLNTILILGSIRPMKRTLHAIKAFEHARSLNPSLQLIVAGDTNSKYAKRVLRYAKQSPHSAAIDIRGRVSEDERLRLMRTCSIILVTSIKEGWGLIVTEANSQGTPAIVYDIDGLRDSVKSEQTGIITPSGDPESMGQAVNDLLRNPQKYAALRAAAWQWSKEFTFENSYSDFCEIIELATRRP